MCAGTAAGRVAAPDITAQLRRTKRGEQLCRRRNQVLRADPQGTYNDSVLDPPASLSSKGDTSKGLQPIHATQPTLNLDSLCKRRFIERRSGAMKSRASRFRLHRVPVMTRPGIIAFRVRVHHAEHGRTAGAKKTNGQQDRENQEDDVEDGSYSSSGLRPRQSEHAVAQE